MACTARYQSFVGTLTLAGDGESLIGLWLEGQKHFGGTVQEELVERPELPVLVAARQWLDRYFRGERPPAAELPLAPRGGAFRQAVWKLLLDIPYGECVSYAEIAKKLRPGGEKTSCRAVGGAVAHNPISIIIPCHRVVGANGALTGYAGGIDKKQKLLERERAAS